ncbi:hypothetical protein JCM30237_19320 [Halolamina litorea]
MRKFILIRDLVADERPEHRAVRRTMSHNDSQPTDVSNTNASAADHYVLGDGELGVSIARRLRASGHAVVIIDETVDPPDVPTVAASPTDFGALREAGVADAAVVVVATPSDRRNLLLAQSIRVRFEEPRLVVLVNTPDRVDLFADAGHDVVCATDAVSTAVAERV